MRVVILFNVDGTLAAGTPADAKAVAAVAGNAEEARAACRLGGHDAVLLPAPEDPELLCAALRSARPEVVLNLCESLRGDARLEAAVAALLELMGVPFTGSRSKALALALDKPLAKAVLRAADVPTPAARVLRTADEALTGLAFPVIVKPSHEDASHGIGLASVCADAAAARARAAFVIERYRQPALAEEFVEGREINVSLLQDGAKVRALPLAEIDFTRFPAGQPHVVTYEAKWVESSPEYQGTPVVAAREFGQGVEARIVEVALAAWDALGLSGYGRVDLRLCPRRGPLVLEVNPNPDLSQDAGFARAAARGGIEYPALIERILREARRG